MAERKVYDCNYCGKTSDSRKAKGWISLDGILFMGQGEDSNYVHAGNRKCETTDYCDILCLQAALGPK
jgi:hypothetical protein